MVITNASNTPPPPAMEATDRPVTRNSPDHSLPPVGHRNPAHSPFKNFMQQLGRLLLCKTHGSGEDAQPSIHHASRSAPVTAHIVEHVDLADVSGKFDIPLQDMRPAPAAAEENISTCTDEPVVEAGGSHDAQTAAPTDAIPKPSALKPSIETAGQLVATLIKAKGREQEDIQATLKKLEGAIGRMPDPATFIGSPEAQQLRNWWGDQPKIVSFNAQVFKLLVPHSDAPADARLVRFALERLAAFGSAEQAGEAANYVNNATNNFSDQEVKLFLLHFLTPQQDKSIGLAAALKETTTQILVYEIADKLLARHHIAQPSDETARKILGLISAASRYASLGQSVTTTVNALSDEKASELLRHTLHRNNLLAAMDSGKNTPRRLLRVVDALVSRVPTGEVWQTCAPFYDQLPALLLPYLKERDHILKVVQTIFSKITQNEGATEYQADPPAFVTRLCTPAEELAQLDPRFAATTGFADFVCAIEDILNTLQTHEKLSIDTARPQGPAHKNAAEILGVKPDASDDEIMRAYRKKALEAHPDKGGSEEAFRRVADAKDKLLRHS